MTSRNTVMKKNVTPPSQTMTIENLLIKNDMKLDESVFVEERPDGIFIRRKKNTIWDFVGKIKATGSVEEERESMIEAVVAHAIGDGT
jgi:hypothetical protein